MRISAAALDLIIGFEVTTPTHYTARLQAPTWPGGNSGVTIGIGFDLGYNDARQIAQAWNTHVTATELLRLRNCAGVQGGAAHALIPSLSDIRIPYEAAAEVFRDVSLPRFVDMTAAAFPGAAELPADCFGALVSLVFNRGAAMEGDRRLEMRQIKYAINEGRAGEVPGFIRQMKRLWPTVPGLLRRRDAEAGLFEEGLNSPTA